MTVMPIILAPDPRLKVVCEPVAAVDDEVRKLMEDLLQSMYAADGIGLAAPQVGVARRVIVVDVARPGEAPHPIRMANPEVVWESESRINAEEGCLSLPQQYAEVERPERVRVRYFDHQGSSRELEAGGLLAKCIQHEMDHLDGVLFVDHLSALRRSMILRRMNKTKRQNAPAL